MTVFQPRECVSCGKGFVPTGPASKFCSDPCRKRGRTRESGEAGTGAGMHRTPSATPEEAAARARRGRKTRSESGVWDDRGKDRRSGREKEDRSETEFEEATQAALVRVEELVKESPGTDHHLLNRIQAVGAAKRQREWGEVALLLEDVAASALAWSVRVARVGEFAPLPAPVRPLVEPAPEDAAQNGHAKGVADRYADVLLDAAARDLAGDEARATLERLLGVGL